MRGFAFVTAILLSSTAAYADCAGEFNSLMNRMYAAGPYRIEYFVTRSATTDQGVIEVMPPDRLSIMAEQFQAIIVGDTWWTRFGSSWVVTPGQDKMITALQSEVQRRQQAEDVRNLSCGQQTMGDQTFATFEYDFTERLLDVDTDAHIMSYVDTSNGLATLQKIETDALGVKSSSVHRITFDPSISISAPE